MCLPEGLQDSPSLGRGDCGFSKIVQFLENYSYFGKDDWQCRYIRGRCSCVCRTKQGRKTRVLWGISWYHRMNNAIAEVSNKLWPLEQNSAVHLTHVR